MLDRTPTTAKLKHDINRGCGGDKVDNIDPAAAPLGTDDEAAGTPPSKQAIAMAYKHEIGSGPTSERSGDWAVPFYVFAMVTIFLTITAGIYLLPLE